MSNKKLKQSLMIEVLDKELSKEFFNEFMQEDTNILLTQSLRNKIIVFISRKVFEHKRFNAFFLALEIQLATYYMTKISMVSSTIITNHALENLQHKYDDIGSLVEDISRCIDAIVEDLLYLING